MAVEFKCPECTDPERTYARWNFFRAHCKKNHGMELPENPDDYMKEQALPPETREKLNKAREEVKEIDEEISKVGAMVDAEKQARMEANIKRVDLAKDEKHACFVTNGLDGSEESYAYIDAQGWEIIQTIMAVMGNLHIFCRLKKTEVKKP